MSRFQAEHSKAQRLAAVRARATRGFTYEEIAAKAGRGELEGAGRFDVKPNTVGKWCRADLADYKPEKLTQPEHAAAAIDTARAGLLAGILAARDAWEKDRRAGKIDLPQAGRILRALQDYERTTRKDKPGRDGDTQTEASEDAATLLAGLAQLANQQPNGGSTERPSAASLSRQHAGQAERPPLTAA